MTSEVYNQILSNVDTTTFNTIAIYAEQPRRMMRGNGYSFLTPACFVEINESNYETVGDGITTSDCDIKFHIIMEQLDGNNGTLDQNLDIFTLRNNIKSAFSLFKLNQGGFFQWKDEDEDYCHSNIYHYILSYKAFNVDFEGQTPYYYFEPYLIVWNTSNINWDLSTMTWDQLFLNEPILNIQGNYD